MDMTENKDHIVEKKIYEDGKKEYASKGVAGTALGLGIAGTALGLVVAVARCSALLVEATCLRT